MEYIVTKDNKRHQFVGFTFELSSEYNEWCDKHKRILDKMRCRRGFIEPTDPISIPRGFHCVNKEENIVECIPLSEIKQTSVDRLNKKYNSQNELLVLTKEQVFNHLDSQLKKCIESINYFENEHFWGNE